MERVFHSPYLDNILENLATNVYNKIKEAVIQPILASYLPTIKMTSNMLKPHSSISLVLLRNLVVKVTCTCF